MGLIHHYPSLPSFLPTSSFLFSLLPPNRHKAKGAGYWVFQPPFCYLLLPSPFPRLSRYPVSWPDNRLPLRTSPPHLPGLSAIGACAKPPPKENFQNSPRPSRHLSTHHTTKVFIGVRRQPPPRWSSTSMTIAAPLPKHAVDALGSSSSRRYPARG